LDDVRFFAPFVPFFHATMGRPLTPIETYLLFYAASAVMPRSDGIGCVGAGGGRVS
jgi:hypothetical protein